MNFFQITPTELHLNGPNVGFSSIPRDANANILGIATFTAIGTASFPYNVVDGSFAFDWYFDGVNIKDASVDSNSNAEIETSGVLGISTLTLSGLDGSDNNKKVYVVANYIKGPDENIIDYPAEGIGRSTSAEVTLTSPPSISITQQPTSVLIGGGNTATFEVAAEIIPGGGTVNYQWNLEGTNLTNGTTSRTVQDSGSTFPTMRVTSNAGDSITLNWNELTTYNSFVPGVTYTLQSSDNLETNLLVFGAGGGGSDTRSISGSKGGVSEGTFTFVKDQEYKLIVGTAGQIVTAGFPGGGTGGGLRGSSGRGGGGGYSGLFLGTISHANSIMIAGGGGGSTGDPGFGGDGGGTTGNPGSQHFSGRAGEGGTQTTGGAGSGSNESGSELQGGNATDAGAGGGGYYGGGGGAGGGTISDGAGGGGSGYIHPTLITDGRTFLRNDEIISATGELRYPGGTEMPGQFTITRVAASKTVTTTVSGAGTQNLEIFSNDQDYGGALKCIVTASNVTNSPLDSNVVSYDVIPPRIVIQFEAYDNNDNRKTLTRDLELTGQFTLNAETFGSEYGIIQFHSKDKDVTIQLDMNAAAGGGRKPWDFVRQNLLLSGDDIFGGEGGKSVIEILARRDVEYTILGVSNNSAIYLYEKARLIAVIGQGGQAGEGGEGGDGGGVNVDGAPGSGPGNGDGGQVPVPLLTGTFGSIVNDYSVKPNLYSGDTINSTPFGGTTVSCTKGRYYLDQGFDPCSDIRLLDLNDGDIPFVNANGTTIGDSSRLYRGFKAGYTVTDTAGKATISEGGNGGAGAQGGQGCVSGNGHRTGGGGGGSGWSDGSSTIISTRLGGNGTGSSFITFGEASTTAGLYVDPFGRILILSCATPGKNPQTLTKTNGRVLFNTDTCIDDLRWQSFLSLANTVDGYRLTATRNDDTRKIITPTDNNLRKMINANRFTLRSSLTGWTDWVTASGNGNYPGDLILTWDETSGFAGVGLDYSGLYWHQTESFAYYGHTTPNQPFTVTSYYYTTANWWILPPGVPDFS